VVRKKNHASVFVLLSLVAMLNASQAMVLCVGSDGHVAIEPAGHDHCADGMHLCESDAAVHDTNLVPDAGGARCHGCTDISLADAIGSDPGASAAAKSVSAAMLVGASQSQIAPNDAASIDISASASLILYHVPLRSIMLQV
jgi:hypothetical protein